MELVIVIGFFLLGAIPFSVIIAGIRTETDIRKIHDGNPGATNAWRVGGAKTGIPALVLDFLKGALPVAILANTYSAAFSGWFLISASLAPVLGHAFSPFLKGKGGKAVAVTFGIWCGLTYWEIPILLGVSLFVFYIIQNQDAWSVILANLSIPVYISWQELLPTFYLVWLGTFVILVYKHFPELKIKPKFRFKRGQA